MPRSLAAIDPSATDPDGLVTSARARRVVVRSEAVRLFAHHNGVNALAFSPDSRCLATGGDDKAGHIWEIETGRNLVTVHHTEWMAWVFGVAFSPDGRWLLTTSRRTRIWDSTTGQQLARSASFWGRFFTTRSARTTAGWDGIRATTTDQQVLHELRSWWSTRDGREMVTFREESAYIDAANGVPLAKVTHDRRVTAAAFSPDRRLLATSSWDRTARICDTATGRQLAEVTHDQGVTCVAFSPDGRLFATASKDKTARVWVLQPGGDGER